MDDNKSVAFSTIEMQILKASLDCYPYLLTIDLHYNQNYYETNFNLDENAILEFKKKLEKLI
jgi:hypothetical protein